MSPSRIFRFTSYGDVTIARKGLQQFGQFFTPKAMSMQGGIFIVPHLLGHGASVSVVSSEGLPIKSPFTYDKQGAPKTSNQDNLI